MPIDMPPADTPANAAADLNVNPKAAEVQHVVYKTFDDREVAKWTPEDLIKTLETVGEWDDEGGYYWFPQAKLYDLFSILFDKVLTWGREAVITYDQISKIIQLASDRPVGTTGGLVREVAALDWEQKVVDFLGEFVVLGEKDARYYDLVEHMLTVQAMGNAKSPLAADLSMSPRFRDSFKAKVLDKLPKNMQERLAEATYYYDDENDDGEVRTYCFSLLSGSVVSVD